MLFSSHGREHGSFLADFSVFEKNNRGTLNGWSTKNPNHWRLLRTELQFESTLNEEWDPRSFHPLIEEAGVSWSRLSKRKNFMNYRFMGPRARIGDEIPIGIVLCTNRYFMNTLLTKLRVSLRIMCAFHRNLDCHEPGPVSHRRFNRSPQNPKPVKIDHRFVDSRENSEMTTNVSVRWYLLEFRKLQYIRSIPTSLECLCSCFQQGMLGSQVGQFQV